MEEAELSDVKKPRKGLGRGLSALLGDEAPAEGTPKVEAGMSVAITRIEPNPDQPRRHFDETALEELARSIRERGVLQPLLVRPNPRGTPDYEIVAGERRWRAAQRAQLHEVPIVVREFSDADTLEVAIIENVQRHDLSPIEEAQGYARLMETFGYTQEQLAQTVAKSRSHIANTLRLLKLPVELQAMLADGRLSAGHARALIGRDDAIELATVAVAQGLSVREIEKRTSKKAEIPAPTAKASTKDADTRALEADLSAALGAKVSISHGSGGSGVLTVKYGSLGQLDSLCEKLGLGDF